MLSAAMTVQLDDSPPHCRWYLYWSFTLPNSKGIILKEYEHPSNPF